MLAVGIVMRWHGLQPCAAPLHPREDPNMAARACSLKDNTADLTDEDLSILNRAGRV